VRSCFLFSSMISSILVSIEPQSLTPALHKLSFVQPGTYSVHNSLKIGL
jgi:hypothetical protein